MVYGTWTQVYILVLREGGSCILCLILVSCINIAHHFIYVEWLESHPERWRRMIYDTLDTMKTAVLTSEYERGMLSIADSLSFALPGLIDAFEVTVCV